MSYMKRFLEETAEMMGMDLNEDNYDEVYLAARIRLDAELAQNKPGVIGLIGFGKPPVEMPDGTILAGADLNQPIYGFACGDRVEEDPVAKEIDKILEGDEDDPEVECDSEVIFEDIKSNLMIEQADDEERRIMKLSQAIDDNDVAKAIGFLEPTKDTLHPEGL